MIWVELALAYFSGVLTVAIVGLLSARTLARKIKPPVQSVGGIPLVKR